jgi:hypothetical protein
MKKLDFLKILFSPFKPFKVKFYVGETMIGVPYFYPRKWVKDRENPGHLKAIPRKVGFDFCGLGWKTKWEETDYRFEWSPVLSFVCFGYQIALTVYSEHGDHYWTSWLYYERDTDKTKSKKERIEQCRKDFPLTFTVYSTNGVKEVVDYYPKILKINFQDF